MIKRLPKMIKRLCRTCGRIWYCKGHKACEESEKWGTLGFARCHCPKCIGINGRVAKSCTEVNRDWRIA